MALQYCYECGKQMSTAAPACPHCGAPPQGRGIVTGARAKSGRGNKNRSTAILLAVFLGGVGIHWFYLDQPGRGVKYLLLCFFIVPIFLAWITAIKFLCMSDEQFESIYG